MSSQPSDIADGIVPETPPEHIAPFRATFKPWHRVRKQFIRQHQWNELTRRNINNSWRADLQKPSNTNTSGKSLMHVSRPLRCLVIPGDDLLDMRALWNDVNPLDCFIHYLGFNEGHGSGDVGTDVHIANNVMTSLPGVLPNCQVLRDRFEAIAAPNSQAFKYLREYGPYHVVNLDLCGSMLPNTAQDVQPYFTAVYKLLQYQFSNQKTNWLLFITTMVEPAVIDREIMEKLCQPTRKNSDKYPPFAEKMGELIPAGVLKDPSKAVNLDGLSDAEMVRLFGVGLGKWLLHLGQSPSPKWTVSMRRSFQYTINKEKNAIMLSLAYDMIPNFAPPIDATGMSGLTVTPKDFPAEEECALKIVESVTKIADVDDRLAADTALRSNLTEEAANLLESCGYDRIKYLEWVSAEDTVTLN